MNPNKTINYSTTNQPNKSDIFEALIKKIRTLQLMIDKHKQAWQFILYGGTIFFLGIVLIIINKN